MQGAVIGKNVKINYGMVDENVVIGDGAIIGDAQSDKTRITLIGRDTVVPRGAKLKSGDIIEKGSVKA